MNRIDLIRGTYGCPCGRHVAAWAINRYGNCYGSNRPWHEAVRSDGGSYHGVVETLSQAQGETLAELVARGNSRAATLDTCGRD